jgi:CIC family chloride channel protein
MVVVKFVGGLLAIGSGMALGREGPTVQIGAGLGQLVGKAFQRNDNERRVLFAAEAGAGLATAFNAPIAGAIFVLEELVGGFDVPVTIATLGASAGAIAVARVFQGQRPDFQVPSLGYPGFATVPAHLVLRIVLGVFGVVYNRAILGGLAMTRRLSRCGKKF